MTSLSAESHLWDRLPPPWQAALEEAWQAYGAGSVPIGAVVTDSQGRIIGRGRNRIGERAPAAALLAATDARPPRARVTGHELAHAELNALLSLHYVDENGAKTDDPHSWALYTTMEPCPLCLGAFYMSGLRALHYAARDPYAGSVNLLGATPYLSVKPIRVTGPHPALELISAALIVAQRLAREGPVRVPPQWQLVLPAGAALGQRLFARQVLPELRARGASAAEMVQQVAAQME